MNHMTALARLLPQFPAYATPLDKAGWWAFRALCVGVLVFLLLPILVVIPLSFSDSTFLIYPITGWSLRKQAAARSASATWYATACACAQTASWSARCVAAKCWKCSRR